MATDTRSETKRLRTAAKKENKMDAKDPSVRSKKPKSQPHQIEPIQSWINTIALATRGLGAIFGANLSVDELASFCMFGALFSLAGALFFYRRMDYLSSKL
jgi:hypothetical protein